MKTIYCIGAGSVGSAAAYEIAKKSCHRILIYDINQGLAKGKALDIAQSVSDPSCIKHSRTLSEVQFADFIIITAGAARRKGMTREDLFRSNNKIISGIFEDIADFLKEKPVLIVTNPTENLVYSVKKKWPGLNVFGFGCLLDSWRLRRFIARELESTADNVQANVIGMHNDLMIPLVGRASFDGIPITDLLDSEVLEYIIDKTKRAGTEIVNAVGTHSGFFAAGAAIADFVDSIVKNREGIYPVSVVCHGEYSYNEICLALPAVFCKDGLRIVEIKLNPKERAALDLCADRMKKIAASEYQSPEHCPSEPETYVNTG
jgi:malate dehydrogenase